jgi:hypothetical protein
MTATIQSLRGMPAAICVGSGLVLGGGGYLFRLGQVGLQLEAVEAEQAVGGPALLPARRRIPPAWLVCTGMAGQANQGSAR